MSRQFSGSRTARTVILLVTLTAIVPPAGAYALARWRIARATADAVRAAADLSTRKDQIRGIAGDAGVLAGPGRLPRGAGAGDGWVQNPVSAAAAYAGAWPTDPWGRAFLLNVGEWVANGSTLLISAGPDGEIATPLSASTPAGDDIAATVR